MDRSRREAASDARAMPTRRALEACSRRSSCATVRLAARSKVTPLGRQGVGDLTDGGSRAHGLDDQRHQWKRCRRIGRHRDAALTALLEALNALHPDEMSPRDALEALYALKAKLPKT